MGFLMHLRYIRETCLVTWTHSRLALVFFSEEKKKGGEGGPQAVAGAFPPTLSSTGRPS